MPERPLEILLVEDDADLADMIVRHLQTSAPSRVTHATSAEEALREELTFRHDLVLTSLAIPDPGGLQLVRGLREGSEAPIVLMVEEPTPEDLIEAIRLRVSDVLCKPFDIADMGELVVRHARQEIRRRRDSQRTRRLRRVASRIVRERGELRQRMDLICRDFVQAYRRLAEKVTDAGILACQEDREG